MVAVLTARALPLTVCFAFGLVMFIPYFSDHSLARATNQTVSEYWQIIFAFALIVGVVNYVVGLLRKIKTESTIVYPIIGLIGFVAMPVLALGWGLRLDSPFMWMFENVQAPMQSTVFALLAFFVASASYRGFRARSLPAGILLASALIILLSRSELGGFFSSTLPDVADWIRTVPSMSARRAILIGIGLGSVTTSLRVILGIERTWVGGEK